MSEPLLDIADLRVRFVSRGRPVWPVDGASLAVGEGEAVGLVGESGCGKSTLALSVLRLLPAQAEIASGSIRLQGVELSGLSADQMRRVRGAQVALMPQDTSSALNPVLTVGEQIAEVLELHRSLPRSELMGEVVRALSAVAIAAPERAAASYPHQLSGGMRQRACLAMALAGAPRLLIADEPTTSVDATLQQQMLEMLDGLRRSRGLGLLLISHALEVVARHCQRLAVMYAGRVVERGSTEQILSAPAHPYTAALLAVRTQSERRGRLRAIPGGVPDLSEMMPGCPFAPRCQGAREECRQAPPSEREVGAGHRVRCLFPIASAAAVEVS